MSSSKAFYMAITPEHYDAVYNRGDTGVSLAAFNPRSALILGSGTGRETIPLLSRGTEVTCVDCSGAMLAALEARVPAGCPVPRLVQADFLAEPIPAGPFDMVAALHGVLAHAEAEAELLALLSQVHASLQAGGAFVVEMPKLRAETVSNEQFTFSSTRSEATLLDHAMGLSFHVVAHDIGEMLRAWFSAVDLFEDDVETTYIAWR